MWPTINESAAVLTLNGERRQGENIKKKGKYKNKTKLKGENEKLMQIGGNTMQGRLKRSKKRIFPRVGGGGGCFWNKI
jgi:hypothetical protein